MKIIQSFSIHEFMKINEIILQNNKLLLRLPYQA